MHRINLKFRFIFFVIVLFAGILPCLCMYYMRRYDGHLTPSMLPPAGLHIGIGKKQFKFAVIGDFQVDGDCIERGIAEIKKQSVDFVLCTGDIARKPQDIRHYNWIAERIYKALDGLPMMFTPGNHDRESKIVFEDGIKPYKTAFGQDEYWFAFGDCLFISINTSRETLRENGIEKLRTILEQERAHYTRLVVFSHVPPIDLRDNSNDCLPERDARLLEDLLSKYNVTMYICGHHHCFSQWTFAGAKLVTVPSCGQKSRSKTHGWGVITVTMGEDSNTNIAFHPIQKLKKHKWEYYCASKLNLTPGIFILGMVIVFIGTFALLLSGE